MRVAIVGAGARPGSASHYDKRWEIWGLNASYLRHPSVAFARMFNLHKLAHLERDCPEYVDWDITYSRHHPKVPMVTVDRWGRMLRNQVIYPRNETAKIPRGEYHASSFDMMVAYAILLKATHIHLHGAHFALDSPREEPISARACLEYWCGYAQGRGIDVQAYGCHGLFKQFHLVMSDTYYGFDDVRMVEERK